MNHRTLAASHAAVPTGMLASFALAALSAPEATGRLSIVDPPGTKALSNRIAADKPPEIAEHASRRTDLLRLRHSTLEQRGVHLGQLRRGGTCVKLDD